MSETQITAPSILIALQDICPSKEWSGKWAAKATTPQLRHLIYEWVLEASSSYDRGPSHLTKQACKAAGVDLHLMEKDIRAGLREKAKPGKKPKHHRSGPNSRPGHATRGPA